VTWRRFHLLLCLVMVAIVVLRIVSGNLLGALLPLVLAAVFASVAFDFPLMSRARRVWRLLRRMLGRHG